MFTLPLNWLFVSTCSNTFAWSIPYRYIRKIFKKSFFLDIMKMLLFDRRSSGKTKRKRENQGLHTSSDSAKLKMYLISMVVQRGMRGTVICGHNYPCPLSFIIDRLLGFVSNDIRISYQRLKRHICLETKTTKKVPHRTSLIEIPIVSHGENKTLQNPFEPDDIDR